MPGHFPTPKKLGEEYLTLHQEMIASLCEEIRTAMVGKAPGTLAIVIDQKPPILVRRRVEEMLKVSGWEVVKWTDRDTKTQAHTLVIEPSKEDKE